MTSAPEKLEVQQATIHRLITPGLAADGTKSEGEAKSVARNRRSLNATRPSSAPSLIESSESNHVQAQEGEIKLYPQEEKRLAPLIKRVRQLPPTQRAILKLLTENEGKEWDSTSISIALGMSRDYLSVHPPLELLKTNLVVRRIQQSGRGKGYLYKSNLLQIAKIALPRHASDKAAQKILAMLNGQ